MNFANHLVTRICLNLCKWRQECLSLWTLVECLTHVYEGSGNLDLVAHRQRAVLLPLRPGQAEQRDVRLEPTFLPLNDAQQATDEKAWIEQSQEKNVYLYDIKKQIVLMLSCTKQPQWIWNLKVESFRKRDKRCFVTAPPLWHKSDLC